MNFASICAQGKQQALRAAQQGKRIAANTWEHDKARTVIKATGFTTCVAIAAGPIVAAAAVVGVCAYAANKK